MRTILLGFILATAATSAHAEGTIQFRNPVTLPNRVRMIDSSGNSILAPTSIPINYGVFFGLTAESVSLFPVLPLGTTHPTLAGIIDAPLIYPLPGTEANQTVFLRVRGWSAEFATDWQTASVSPGAWFGETPVKPFILGHEQGPATVIWSGETNPERFFALELYPAPEPSTLTLAAVGCLLLLLRRRKWSL